MGLEPPLDRLDDDLLLRCLSFLQLEERSHGVVGGGQGFLRLGRGPEYGFILLTIAIGVFNRDLSLANAAKSADSLRLREGGCLTCLQLLMQAFEQIVAASKE